MLSTDIKCFFYSLHSISSLLSFLVFCFWVRAGRVFMTPSCGMLPGDREKVRVCVCCVSKKKGFIMLYKVPLLSECYNETWSCAHNALVAIVQARPLCCYRWTVWLNVAKPLLSKALFHCCSLLVYCMLRQVWVRHNSCSTPSHAY